LPGAAGSTGATGAQGTPGFSGSNGAPGTPGVQGGTGATGELNLTFDQQPCSFGWLNALIFIATNGCDIQCV
jgi:hypothetical protein